MSDFNPRKYMELAIEIMKKSIPERREDGKAPPKVGAILVSRSNEAQSRDQITTAYRGELRQGDHAEYTLLERKCRDRKLDDSILFATLEPCAPQARKFPKLGCAERIVLARIKEVWVGIEDPDPTVDRKGIQYLLDNGVHVHLFDPDLQEIIRAENHEFLSQAKERASESENPPHDIPLSPFESMLPFSRISDFSTEALEEYRSRANIKGSIESPEFKQRLVSQNLVQIKKNELVPTGFGILLFGREPRAVLPQAGILATIYYPDGTEEKYDFDGPQIFVPREILSWLNNKLPNVMNRSQAIRTYKNDELFKLVREGVVNALVHRDYGIEGAKIKVNIRPGSIEICSPGLPVSPITLERMQSLNAPSLSRNPLLHYVFAIIGLAEERGLGLRSMQQQAESLRLPLPQYTWDDPFLILTILSTLEAATDLLPQATKRELSEGEEKGWQWLSTRQRTSSAEYAKANNVTVRTAHRHLSHFVELGLTVMIGSGPSTEYKVR